jgi:TolA-binding protein
MRIFMAIALVLGCLAVAGCSGRKVEADQPAEAPKDSKEQRMESLASSLSRTQSRLEEMDAKLSALADKVEAMRLTVDNVAGNKPLKTQAVGSAAAGVSDLGEEKPAKSTGKKGKAAVPTVAGGASDPAVGEFEKAMRLFRSGNYTDAEMAFTHVAESFPEHILAGSAQFYGGESYFMMGEYKLALNEYMKVPASFASSPRVASAMVRIGHCYEAIGNGTESARTLALARDSFPGNPSLDWAAPSPNKKAETKTETKPVVAKELSAAPIEPAAKKAAKDSDEGLDDKEKD